MGHDPLFENAISSIELGIDDYRAADPDGEGLDGDGPDPRRALSAVRNVYAGLLLLLKETLRRFNSDALYEKTEVTKTPNGSVVVGPPPTKANPKTVNTDELVRRLSLIGVTVDEVSIERLKDIRDHIEHRSPQHSTEQIRAAISASYLMMSVLMANLGTRAQDVLKPRVWSAMLEADKLYGKLLIECRSRVAKRAGLPAASRLDLSCPDCASALIDVSRGDKPFECRECLETFEMRDMFEMVFCGDCRRDLSLLEAYNGECSLCAQVLEKQGRGRD